MIKKVTTIDTTGDDFRVVGRLGRPRLWLIGSGRVGQRFLKGWDGSRVGEIASVMLNMLN